MPPQVKNQEWLVLGTLGASARDHGDQSSDLETADLTKGARGYHTLCLETF